MADGRRSEAAGLIAYTHAAASKTYRSQDFEFTMTGFYFLSTSFIQSAIFKRRNPQRIFLSAGQISSIYTKSKYIPSAVEERSRNIDIEEDLKWSWAEV